MRAAHRQREHLGNRRLGRLKAVLLQARVHVVNVEMPVDACHDRGRLDRPSACVPRLSILGDGHPFSQEAYPSTNLLTLDRDSLILRAR